MAIETFDLKVPKGATVSALVKEYKTDYDTILKLNPTRFKTVKDLDFIQEGEVLKFPKLLMEVPLPVVSTPNYFEIKIPGGSNLGSIAKQYSTTPEAIQAINPDITDPDFIVAGASMKIPKVETLGFKSLYEGKIGTWMKPYQPEVGFSGYWKEGYVPYQTPVKAEVKEVIPPIYKPESFFAKVSDFVSTKVIQPLQKEVKEAVFGLASSLPEIPTSQEVAKITGEKVKTTVENIWKTLTTPVEKPSVVPIPEVTSILSIPSFGISLEKVNAWISKKIPDFFSFAKGAKTTATIIATLPEPTGKGVSVEALKDAEMTEEEKMEVDPTNAFQKLKSLKGDLDKESERAKLSGLVFLFDEKGNFVDFENLFPELKGKDLEAAVTKYISDNFSKLTQDKIAEQQAKLNLTSPLVAEANSKVKENQDLQAKIFKELDSELTSIFDFVNKPENLDTQKMIAFSKSFQDKFGSPQEFKDLDSALTNLQDFSSTQKDFVDQFNKLNKEYEDLQSETNGLINPAIQDFMEKQAKIDTLSDAEVSGLRSFYNANKISIDRLITISTRINEIVNWNQINAIRINLINERISALTVVTKEGVTVPLYIDKLNKILTFLNDPKFIEGLTAYSVKTEKPQTELLKLLKKFQENTVWYSEHENQIKDETTRLDQDSKSAQQNINAYVEELDNKSDNLFNLLDQVDKAQKNYTKSLQSEEMKWNDHNREVTNNWLHPLQNITKLVDKETLVDFAKYFVPEAVESGLTVATYGLWKLAKPLFNWYYNTFKEKWVPFVQAGLAFFPYNIAKFEYNWALLTQPGPATEKERNYWKEQLWAVDLEAQRNWMNFPIFELKEVDTLEKRSELFYKFFEFYRNPDNYSNLKFKKEVSLTDLIPKGSAMTILNIMAVNPDITDPYHVPTGTVIKYPRFDPIPKLFNLLPIETQIELSTKHPLAYELGNMFGELMIDPLMWGWSAIIKNTGELAGFIGLKPFNQLKTLAEKYTWAANMQDLMKFSTQTLRLVTGKPITKEFEARVPSLSKFRSNYLGMTLAQNIPYDARLKLSDITSGLSNGNQSLIAANIGEALMKEATASTLAEAGLLPIAKAVTKIEVSPAGYKAIGKAMLDIKNEIVQLVAEPWRLDRDRAVNVFNRLGIDSFQLYDLAKEFPEASKMLSELIKTLTLTKPRAGFMAAMLDKTIATAPSLSQSVFLSLYRQEGPTNLELRKTTLLAMYADHLPEVYRGFKLMEDWNKKTETWRFLHENSGQILKIPGIEIMQVSEKTKKLLKGESSILFFDEKIDSWVILFDPLKKRLPEIMTDVYSKLGGVILQNLENITAYNLVTLYPHKHWKATRIAEGIKKTYPIVEETKVFQQAIVPTNPVKGDLWIDTSVTPNLWKRWDGKIWKLDVVPKITKGDSIVDALVTSFLQDINPRLSPDKQVRLRALLQAVDPDIPGSKSFRVSFAKPFDQVLTEQAEEGWGVSPFEKDTDYEVDYPEKYNSIIAYFREARALKQLKEMTRNQGPGDEGSFAQEYQLLQSIPVDELTPVMKLRKFLLTEMGGFLLTEFQENLLLSDELLPIQEAETLKEISRLGAIRRRDRQILVLKNRAKVLATKGLDSKEIWRDQQGINTSIIYNNAGIQEVKKLKNLTSLKSKIIELPRYLPRQIPYHPRLPKRGEAKEAFILEKQMGQRDQLVKRMEELSKEEGANVIKVFQGLNKDVQYIRNKIMAILPNPFDKPELTKPEQDFLEAASKEHILEIYDITPKDKIRIKFLEQHNLPFEIIPAPLATRFTKPEQIIKELERLSLKPTGLISDSGIIKLMAKSFDWPTPEELIKTKYGWLLKGTNEIVFEDHYKPFGKSLLFELVKTKSGRLLLTNLLLPELPLPLGTVKEKLAVYQEKFGMSETQLTQKKTAMSAGTLKNILKYINWNKPGIFNAYGRTENESKILEFIENFNFLINTLNNSLGIKVLDINIAGGQVTKINSVMTDFITGYEALQDNILMHSDGKHIGNMLPKIKEKWILKELPPTISFDSKTFLERYLKALKITSYANLKGWEEAQRQMKERSTLRQNIVDLENEMSSTETDLAKIQARLNNIYHLPELKAELPSPVTLIKPREPQLPKEIKLEYKSPLLTKDGRCLAAQTSYSEKTIYIDKEKASLDFVDKAWSKPKIKGVRAFPLDIFKTEDRWINFLIKHELQHLLNPRKVGEDLGSYENRINILAIKSRLPGKVIKPLEVVPIKEIILSNKEKEIKTAEIDAEKKSQLLKEETYLKEKFRSLINIYEHRKAELDVFENSIEGLLEEVDAIGGNMLNEELEFLDILKRKTPITLEFLEKIDKAITLKKEQLEPIKTILIPGITKEGLEEDIESLKNLKEIAPIYQLGRANKLLPFTKIEFWNASKQIVIPSLEEKLKKLGDLIEKTGLKGPQLIVQEFKEIPERIPELIIKGVPTEELIKRFFVGDMLDPNRPYPIIKVWYPDIGKNPDLTPMAFDVSVVNNQLKEAGTVFTVRAYIMKDKTVWVEGIGTADRKFIKEIKSPEELLPYLSQSGFTKVEDWWRQIQKFARQRNIKPLEDLLKAGSEQLKTEGRKVLGSFDGLAKKMKLPFDSTEFSMVVTNGIMPQSLQTKITELISILKKQPKGLWLYEVASKPSPINLEKIIQTLQDWDQKRFGVVVDLDKILDGIDLSKLNLKLKIIKIPNLQRDKLKWFSTIPGSISSKTEIAGMEEFTKIFFDVYKIGILSRDARAAQIKELFYGRYLTKANREFIEGVKKDITDEEGLAARPRFSGPPYVFPTELSPWSEALLPVEAIIKEQPIVEREVAFHDARMYLEKSELLIKRVHDVDPFKGNKVIIVGPNSTYLSSEFKDFIKEAIERKIQFYFPELANKSEKATMEFLDAAGIKYNKLSLTGKNLGGILDGIDENLPYYVLPSSMYLYGIRKTLLSALQKRERMMKSFEIMKKDMIDQFINTVKRWNLKVDKAPPEHIREAAWRHRDPIGLLTKLIMLKDTNILKERLITLKKETLVNTETNLRDELLKQGKRNYLLPKELEFIKNRLSEQTQTFDSIYNDVLKLNKKPDWFERNQEKSARKLRFGYNKTSDTYNLGGFPIEAKGLGKFRLWLQRELKRPIQDQFFWDFPRAMQIPRSMLGVGRTVWVGLVLVLRPAWFVWNTLSDAFREAVGAGSLGLFFDIVGANLNATTKFLFHFAGDWAQIVLDTSNFYDWAKRITQKEAKGFYGSHLGKLFLSEVKKTVEAKGKLFSLEEYYVAKQKGIGSFIDGKLWGNRIREIVSLRNMEKKTIAGEIMKPEHWAFNSSSGLYSVFSDPVALKKIQNMLPEATLFQRAKKRFSAMYGDLWLFAGATEQMRRQMTVYEMVFHKGMTIAKSEVVTKKYAFDYRDLTRVGQMFRNFFPFYTFTAKSMQLWFWLAIKGGYRTYLAAKMFAKAFSMASQDLPDYYKERINIGNEVYWSPNFSIWNFILLCKDPTRAIQEFTDNPLRTIATLGWDPFLAQFIERVQGKNYFKLSWYLKETRGWTQWEIDKYLKEEHIDDVDYSSAPGTWMEFLLAFVPFAPLLKSLTEIDESMILRSVSWLNSPVVRNLFKFFGLNVRKLDDIEKLRTVYFDLPPHLRHDWVNEMKKDNPDLYKIWQDYWSASMIVKVTNATGTKKIELMQKMEAQGFINIFYALEDQQEGTGYDWLKRNNRAQAFLNLHWKGLELTPWRMASRDIYTQKVLQSQVITYLKSIPATMTDEKIAALKVMGIDSSYTGAFNKEDLRNDIFDEHGNLKVSSIDELNLLLQEKGWFEKGLEKLGPEIIKKAETAFLEWRMATSQAQKDKKFQDALYYHHLATVFGTLPTNLEILSETEQRKYWDEWKATFERVLSDEEKARYMRELPDVQRKYLEAMKKYIDIWSDIFDQFKEGNFDFFKIFYFQPKWFQDLYFLKHRNKATWYAFASKWIEMLRVIQEKEATGELQIEARKVVSDFFWAPENRLAREAWDRDNPVFIAYMSIWKNIMVQTESNPQMYFKLFYEQPQWFQDRFFKANPEKATYYPFIRKWVEFIELDTKNKVSGKTTDFAEQWFWSPSHKVQRESYAKANPIGGGKTKVDYLELWQKLIQKSEEDIKIYYSLFESEPEWFKIHFFKNHPEKKDYYEAMIKISKLPPEEFPKVFFESKYTKERTAIEKSNPDLIKYMSFWKELSDYADTGNWDSYFNYYFSATNSKYRERHWITHPEAEQRMKEFRDYSQMPSMTWEERRAKREYLKIHPILLEWWAQDISAADAAIRKRVEVYFGLLDNVKADGSGRSYYLDYRKWKSLADKYLKDNPDILLFLERKPGKYTGQKAEIFTLIGQYESFTFPEEKRIFLDIHPVLAEYFLNSNPPGIRKILKMQNEYFSLLDSRKAAYLELYPELKDWWDIGKLPASAFWNPLQFREWENLVSKIDKAFDAYRIGDWKLGETLRSSLPEVWLNPGTSDEEEWMKERVYRLAMETWIQALQRNQLMGIYFFRQLPRWLRDQYYTKHPEKRYLSTETFSRFIEEPLRVESSSDPEVTEAFYYLRKYGKNMPFKINEKVREILVRKGIWSSRSGWTSADWEDYWKRRALQLNNLHEQDFQNLPLLRKEMIRVMKTYPIFPKPKPFNYKGRRMPRLGLIQPLF